MDEYYSKYARPLGKINLFELKNILQTWRDNLRDELEGLIYLRNGLNNDTASIYIILSYLEIEMKVRSKLVDIINKLENIIIKEIECMSEFMYDVRRYLIY